MVLSQKAHQVLIYIWIITRDQMQIDGDNSGYAVRFP